MSDYEEVASWVCDKEIRFHITFGNVGDQALFIIVNGKELKKINKYNNEYLSCDGVVFQLSGKILEISRCDSNLNGIVFYARDYEVKEEDNLVSIVKKIGKEYINISSQLGI